MEGRATEDEVASLDLKDGGGRDQLSSFASSLGNDLKIGREKTLFPTMTSLLLRCGIPIESRDFLCWDPLTENRNIAAIQEAYFARGGEPEAIKDPI